MTDKMKNRKYETVAEFEVLFVGKLSLILG